MPPCFVWGHVRISYPNKCKHTRATKALGVSVKPTIDCFLERDILNFPNPVQQIVFIAPRNIPSENIGRYFKERVISAKYRKVSDELTPCFSIFHIDLCWGWNVFQAFFTVIRHSTPHAYSGMHTCTPHKLPMSQTIHQTHTIPPPHTLQTTHAHRAPYTYYLKWPCLLSHENGQCSKNHIFCINHIHQFGFARFFLFCHCSQHRGHNMGYGLEAGAISWGSLCCMTSLII